MMQIMIRFCGSKGLRHALVQPAGCTICIGIQYAQLFIVMSRQVTFY
uniref:Uncharacterized protein n=1 Tax=Rhizophora mucronata TaxID=61149 RepID=A0A2P2R3Y4_RHIMU